MAIGLDLWLVKSVRADMVKRRVKVVLEGRLDERMMKQVDGLRQMVELEMPVDVTIMQRQKGLPLMRLEEAAEEAEG